MVYEIKDKVVLITGACGGIGSKLVQELLNEGAKFVAILDVEKPNGEKQLTLQYGKGKVKYYRCNVANEINETYDAVIKDAGSIDVVVNNAGIFNDGPREYLDAINVNFAALVTSSLKALKLMRKDHGGKGGTIINISSIAGISQIPALPIYSATKSAVLQFSNAIGMEPHYSRTGVRVITMCFGCTDTIMLAGHKYGAFDNETDDEDLIGQTVRKLPMQKPEAAAKGTIHAYKHGSSASTWLVSADKTAVDITENVKKAYEIMSQGILDL